MPSPLPPLRLTGATVLRDRELQDRTVAMADGRISGGPFPAIDLSGYYILPGIIDLHGDAFERHAAPRPSAPFPWETGLRATDRDAASHGVTTAWMAHSWSWEGGMRSPDHCTRFMAGLDAYRAEALTDLRVQIRCETHTVDTGEALGAIKEDRPGCMVIDMRLPERPTVRMTGPALDAYRLKRATESGEGEDT